MKAQDAGKQSLTLPPLLLTGASRAVQHPIGRAGGRSGGLRGRSGSAELDGTSGDEGELDGASGDEGELGGTSGDEGELGGTSGDEGELGGTSGD